MNHLLEVPVSEDFYSDILLCLCWVR